MRRVPIENDHVDHMQMNPFHCVNQKSSAKVPKIPFRCWGLISQTEWFWMIRRRDEIDD